MRKLTATICLTFAVLLGSAGVSASADLNKGLSAFKRGDFITALREWKPLAEQGNSLAQYNVGLIYNNGNGIPRDAITAAEWFRLAADQGDVRAQYMLGVMYARGDGVSKDLKTSVKWFKTSAEQGFPLAQYNLAFSFYDGSGIARDLVSAYMWFKLAAFSGYKPAVKNIDVLAKKMTSSQLELAQDLVRECVRKKYKGC